MPAYLLKLGTEEKESKPTTTLYAAALQSLKDTVTHSHEEKNRTSIAIPYGIGCGLAGGDWTIVEDMIEEVLGDCEVTVYRFK
ncbi:MULTISPECIES: hypothetical protein [Bacillus]|uniref:hypothetical protein n=1 Tax=Bacillus TaxID=1386 RepID=UPI0020BF3F6A|nr:MULTISPECIES: hypothetical protein [Bacillus]UUD44268.1 hypothetical protein NPA43_08500 [Bacillus pumilus]